MVGAVLDSFSAVLIIEMDNLNTSAFIPCLLRGRNLSLFHFNDAWVRAHDHQRLARWVVAEIGLPRKAHLLPMNRHQSHRCLRYEVQVLSHASTDQGSFAADLDRQASNVFAFYFGELRCIHALFSPISALLWA